MNLSKQWESICIATILWQTATVAVTTIAQNPVQKPNVNGKPSTLKELLNPFLKHVYRILKGVYSLNKQSNFDFQLNRLIMWDGSDLEEVER